MSLLEDVFLEDEAGEAQELERVIEGDELDDRPRTPDSNENSEKEDEAEEDKRVVDHTAKAKRVVKNPRFVLNPARLMGPRGIQIIPEHFKDFKFKGKGHERQDLDLVLKKLEHWAYRLYPKFKFDDCLKKIETLGRKRPVMVHLHKIRTDQYISEETVQQQDSSGDEAAPAPQQEEDEFDRLLQQQIELARSTPAPNSTKKELHTPMSTSSHISPFMLPKVSSSPSISDEQKERMMKNRRLAEERRLARLNQANRSSENVNTSIEAITNTIAEKNTETNVNDTESTNMDAPIVTGNDIEVIYDDDKDAPIVRKHNRTNVIDSDSSDDENEIMAVNESVTVDVHNSVNNVNSSNESIKEKAEVSSINDNIDMKRDSDDDIVINDVEDEPVVKKNNRSNVIDTNMSADQNAVAVNEPDTVDVQNPLLNDNDTEEHNSDKENTAVEMNMESDKNVTADVLINNKLSINKNSKNDINERILLDTDTSKDTDENVTADVLINNKLSMNKNSENDINERIPLDNETSKDTRPVITSDSFVKESDRVSSDIPNEKEPTKDNGSVTEELMDVDFSDDF